MPKELKENSSRKPPVPVESHADTAKWIKGVMPGLHSIVKYLDKTIRDLVPNVHYGIKWNKAHYGLPERGWIIEMVSYNVSVNVVFLGGADFDEPPPLGTTGRSRYVKVASLEEAKAPEIRSWIEQAARTKGWT